VESVGARVARPKEGMRFWSRNDHGKIVNYPKLHHEDGVRKNSPERTNGWYKPRARIFKNARTYLVDQGTVSDDLAPSYFLECPLWHTSSPMKTTSFCKNSAVPLPESM
jgi:hypothetical protein